jgi:sarcosine oxidase, subunit beta
LRETADVVVIGGGIAGLSTAYHLAKMGQSNVEVIEQGYVGSGASTRNAEHLGTAFSNKTMVQLASETVKIHSRLPKETGFNTLFYNQPLFVTGHNEEHARELKIMLEHQSSVGLRAKLITPKEMNEILPFLNLEGITDVGLFKDDGHAHHDGVIWALDKGASQLGVGINTHAKALGIEVNSGKVTGVITDKGKIRTSVVVNAAGAWAKSLAASVGINLPSVSRRREIMVTEPLKHVFHEYVDDMETGIYFNQTLRGEIVGAGIEGRLTTTTFDISSSTYFVKEYMKILLRFFPALKHVNMMRQWAGLRDRTIDHIPIAGRTDGIDGFYQLNGFFGYGFTFGPIFGKLIAEDILKGKPSISLDMFNLRRFEGSRPQTNVGYMPA